jgi:hypothetical protein
MRPIRPRTAIKLILDNHSAHTSRETRAWLAERPAHRLEFTRMPTRFGRQIGTSRCDRLNARLLVIGDDCDLFFGLVLRRGRLPEDFHLAIDAQHLGHLGGKIRVTLLQVVA